MRPAGLRSFNCVGGELARNQFRNVRDINFSYAGDAGIEGDLLAVRGPKRPARQRIAEIGNVDQIRSVSIANPNFAIAVADGLESNMLSVGGILRIVLFAGRRNELYGRRVRGE